MKLFDTVATWLGWASLVGGFVALFILALTQLAQAHELVHAGVLSVYDGDTLTIEGHPWPNVAITASIRVRGVDTPELRGRCPEEKALARDFTRAFVASSDDQVWVVFHGRGKYGRLIAEVYDAARKNLAAELIAADLGRAYDGGKREGWCEL